MRQAELARAHPGRPSPDHRHRRRAVVGGAERWLFDQPPRGQRQAGDRMDPGRLQRRALIEAGEQAGQPVGQHHRPRNSPQRTVEAQFPRKAMPATDRERSTLEAPWAPYGRSVTPEVGSPEEGCLVTLEARLALLDERGDGFGGVGRAEVDRLGP